MCGKLDHYKKLFAKLSVNRNAQSWSPLTRNASPYKPFLLLSVMDLIATGEITRNFIELTHDLAATFQGYISTLPPMNRKAIIAYPFFHLRSSGFWQLKPRSPKSTAHSTISSSAQLQSFYYGAEIDNELFMLLKMPPSRAHLRRVLIQTFFIEEVHNTLRTQAYLNCNASMYANELLHMPTTGNLETAEGLTDFADDAKVLPEKEQVRDQGFRKAVVKLYDHRCALCGIKMLTSEGHTIVDAAHIIPWSESHDDEPTNGMALCKLCHWSFDKGLMSVDPNYQVMISPYVKKDPNLPGHIMTLSDRPVFRPTENRFLPDQHNFAWHRKQRFQS